MDNYKIRFYEQVFKVGISIEESEKILDTCEGDYRTAYEMLLEIKPLQYTGHPALDHIYHNKDSFLTHPHTSTKSDSPYPTHTPYVIVWLILGVYVHSRLWGDYNIPTEDSLMFFLIDAFVSFILIALFAGAIELVKKIL